MIVRLNPHFNCCKSLGFHWIYKIATEKLNFVSVNAKVIATGKSEITQIADQVCKRLISKLANGIWRVLQKLLEYFSGIAFSTSLLSTAFVSFINFDLSLNDSESLKVLFGPFLRWYHNFSDVLE